MPRPVQKTFLKKKKAAIVKNRAAPRTEYLLVARHEVMASNSSHKSL
jgi:hypothetical protein